MPRAADPELSERIARVALQILDDRGLEAVTMRSVAAAAKVATTTIYERYTDRPALLAAMLMLGQRELLDLIQASASVEASFRVLEQYYYRHPNRFTGSVELYQKRLAAGERMPVLQALRELVARQTGLKGIKLQARTLAIVAVGTGFLRAAIAAGPESLVGKRLRRACYASIRLLLLSK